MNDPTANGTPDDPNRDRAAEEHEFFERITRYLNDGMSPDEVRRFDGELQRDARKQELFVRACLIQSAISEKLATQYTIFRESLFRETAQAKDSPAASPQWPSPKPVRRRSGAWKFRAAAAILALAALPVGIIVAPYVMKAPPMPPFARVTDSNNARWTAGPEPGGMLPPRVDLMLASGWAEITYDSGTRVTVIGPATFNAQSPHLLDLHSGRISAKVADRKFEVLTPEARITDLGTEFGVSMLDRTDFAVFSGKIAASARNDAPSSERQTFTEGAAASFAGDKIVEETRQAWPQLFPRRLPEGVTRLSVADLLSGGEGTMNRRAAAVDVGTGAWYYGRGTLLPASAVGDHGYHKVSNIRVIDGCFVPDGKMPIDSTGREFPFPATSNVSINQMWVGGIIPWLRDDPHRMGTVLGGIDYSQSPHALVEFHSNKGLTLDLEELRAIHPGVVLGAFHAVIGNVAPPMLGGERFVARADLRIFVDGNVRMEKTRFTNHDAPFDVDFHIDPGDRFLTLAVTDGGDGTDGDYVLLGDPEITVASTGPAQ